MFDNPGLYSASIQLEKEHETQWLGPTTETLPVSKKGRSPKAETQFTNVEDT